MADDFATTDDVVAIWRPLSPTETTQAETLLRFASALIRQEVLAVDERIAAGRLDAAVVTMVAAEMVKRRLENPSGVRSETEQVGPFSRTAVRDQEHSAGGVYLTARELRLLSGRRSSAFSVTPHRPETTAEHLAAVELQRVRREAGW